jgi:hypothetical protein
MGCGKGYLTFAAYDHLARTRDGAVHVLGIEARPELVNLCNAAARECGFEHLRFEAGRIADAAVHQADVLIALHACDTATDDALAIGIRAGAALLVTAPCCHKEVRPLMRPPTALTPALAHGILLEREAEFVTDALRAALLEWSGYEARVFEFVAPEHTSKNVMIAAGRRTGRVDRDALAQRARALAAHYGIRTQHLARLLDFDLDPVAPR